MHGLRPEDLPELGEAPPEGHTFAWHVSAAGLKPQARRVQPLQGRRRQRLEGYLAPRKDDPAPRIDDSGPKTDFPRREQTFRRGGMTIWLADRLPESLKRLPEPWIDFPSVRHDSQDQSLEDQRTSATGG